MQVTLIASTELHGLTCFSDPSDLERISYKAAKVCVGQKTSGTEPAEKVKKFLNNTINKRGHESIMEHWSCTFLIEGISRACSHQLVRHRIASYSQESQRYCEVLPYERTLETLIIPDDIYKDIECLEIYLDAMDKITEAYHGLLDKGIKKEDARAISPQCHSTTIMVTMNARSLKNFFKERLWNKHAQGEINNLAREMYELVKNQGNYFDEENCGRD